MMTLLLSQADVRKALSMKDAVQAVEEAFAQFASGRVEMPQRTVMHMPEEDALAAFMPGYIPGMGALGIKAVSLFRRNREIGLPSIHGVVLLMDSNTGQISAIMDGAYLTAIRTGAASGVATKYLAREDAEVAAILGAGVQGVTQLEAVCEVRSITSAWVYDTDEDAAAQYAEQMGARGGRIPADIRVASSVDEAVGEADVICTATTAKTPILDGETLPAGVHVNAIGSHAPGIREIDTATILRSKVVCDSTSACLEEAGDLLLPIQEGAFSAEDIYGDLGDVIVGSLPGRQAEDEITLFKSVGLALQDVSTAVRAYREAKNQGIGMEFAL
jgi:alanine dehydrogenase